MTNGLVATIYPIDYVFYIVPLLGLMAGMGFILAKLDYPDSISWPVAVWGSVVCLAIASASFLLGCHMVAQV